MRNPPSQKPGTAGARPLYRVLDPHGLSVRTAPGEDVFEEIPSGAVTERIPAGSVPWLLACGAVEEVPAR